MRGWGRPTRLVGAVAAAVALAGCWPAPGQGPDRRGFNSLERSLTIDNVGTLQPEWDVPAAGGQVRGLVASNGVLVANTGPYVRAFSMSTGALRWSVGPAFRSIPYGQPVIAGGSAYIPHTLVGTTTSRRDLQTGDPVPSGGLDGGVVAFRGAQTLVEQALPDANFTTGTYSFRVDDDTPPGSTWGGVTHVQVGLDHEDAVHVSLGTDKVFASGYGLMTTSPGDGTSGVAVRAFGPGQPATCGPTDNPVYACPLWVTPIDGTVPTPPVIGPGGATIHVATNAGTLYAIDAATGAVQWSAAMGAPVLHAPALTGEWLYVPLSTGDVHVLPVDGCGAATCAPAWVASTGGVVGAQPSVAGGVLYVGTEAGQVWAFAADGCAAATCEPVWSYDLGSPVRASAIVTEGRLLVGTSGGRLVSFRPSVPPPGG